MNILCAVGIRGGGELVRRVLEVTGPDHDLHLLHVTDAGPRHALEHLLHGPRHRPPPPPGRDPSLPTGPERRITEAEERATAAILDEARREAERAGFRCHLHAASGRPEQLVVARAEELGCQLAVIRASEGGAGTPRLGPASVGHTARFVLDHAPCDVLLVRSR
ncbi:MAG TPA: universal stress protein [Anaeromyxobacter sp.]|nr:universal stress protein [Anaeromyxobacter sp.]